MGAITINSHSSSNGVYLSNASFSTARNAATGDGLSEQIACEYSASVYMFTRVFTTFDLSTIPSSSVITAIDFKIYVEGADYTDDFTLVTSTHTAPNTTLAKEDYDALTINSPTEYSSRSAYASTFPSPTTLTFSLNATAIAAAQALLGGSDYFKVVVRPNRDVDNSVPTKRSYIYCDGGTRVHAPRIEVTYSLPSSKFLGLL